MRLMTNTGRTVEIDWAGRSTFDRVLYIGTLGLTMAEAATIFGDPSETSRITVYKDEENPDEEGATETYTGFVELWHLRNNPIEGTILVGLARQEVDE